MMEKKVLKTECLKIFVLEDSTELFSRHFKQQTLKVFNNLPRDIPVALLYEIRPAKDITLKKYKVCDPSMILIKNAGFNLKDIKQYDIHVDK